MIPFIQRKRLFSERGNISHPALFIFDILLLFFFYLAINAWDNLAPFRSGEVVVIVNKTVFGILGSSGFYGIRVASYIALYRRNKSPQSVEWAVCLIGLAVAMIGLSCGSLMLRLYAEINGYSFCFTSDNASDEYVFTLKGLPCQSSK